MDEIRLLVDLLEVPSPSGSEEAACVLFAERARAFGFRVHCDAVGNVLARSGNGSPHTMFLGHVDTVPGTWPVRVDGGTVSGRGAVDAKGSLTAGLLAAARLAHAPGTRTVVAAVGEEDDSRGAVEILRGSPPDSLIVGEPSGWDRVAIGYRGQRMGTLFVSGVPAHGSSPHPSPLDRAIASAARLQSFVAAHAGGSLFDSPSCRFVRWTHEAHVGEESAAFEVDVRAPMGFDWRALEDATPDIRWSRAVDGVVVDKGNDVVRALVAGIREMSGRPEYVLKAGSSDMNHAARAWKIPMASYGPGDPKLGHGPEERLSVEEFLRAIDVLERAFLRLSGSDVGLGDSSGEV